MSTQRLWLAAGAISGLIAVAAGAFGAHALRDLPPRYVGAFKTGAEYQMYHALALLAVAGLGRGRWTPLAGGCFVLGTLLFSGSLYALALTQADRWGALTPIGGTFFLLGWLLLALAGWQRFSAQDGSRSESRP